MKNFAEQPQFGGREAKQEKRNKKRQTLEAVLEDHSKKTNYLAKREYRLKNLLLLDGTLDPEGYAELLGEEALKEDAKFIRDREIDFTSAEDPNVQAHYRREYGIDTQDGIIAKWRENKSRDKNGKMEMAVTALLAEKLGRDFIVVRTSAYDDYANGVDNLILDRVTGEVVGAFDEVHEGGYGERTKEKKIKIKKIAERGGTDIRYGLRLNEGKLERASLTGVPVFYLGLSNAELTGLMQGLAENDTQKTDAVYETLLDSLMAQHDELSKSEISAPMRARLATFGETLSRLLPTQNQKAA